MEPEIPRSTAGATECGRTAGRGSLGIAMGVPCINPLDGMSRVRDTLATLTGVVGCATYGVPNRALNRLTRSV